MIYFNYLKYIQVDLISFLFGQAETLEFLKTVKVIIKKEKNVFIRINSLRPLLGLKIK